MIKTNKFLQHILLLALAGANVFVFLLPGTLVSAQTASSTHSPGCYQDSQGTSTPCPSGATDTSGNPLNATVNCYVFDSKLSPHMINPGGSIWDLVSCTDLTTPVTAPSQDTNACTSNSGGQAVGIGTDVCGNAVTTNPANTTCSSLKSEGVTAVPGVNCNDNTNATTIITDYLNPLINILASIVGTVCVASIIYGGIQYSSSAGDPQKAAKAKKRILSTLIAFIAFLFLYSFLQFIIPGGLLHSTH